MVRVMSVTNVDLHLMKSHPPKIAVWAEGKVASSGWRDASLDAWRYIAPPADGIQDFDFTAEPPAGSALAVVRPISAEALLENVSIENYWGPSRALAGVRVHAQDGAKVVMLGAEAKTTLLMDDTIPWPWKPQSNRELPLPADVVAQLTDFKTMRGKVLRVYHTGDALTMDLRRDRANVELGPDERIVQVWIG